MEDTKDSFREALKERITYLVKTEFEELEAIDSLASLTIERNMKWKLINELCMRRQELQDALKLYDKHKKATELLQSEAELFAEHLTCEGIINIGGEWYYEDGKELDASKYRHTDKTTADLYMDFKRKVSAMP